jgi:trimethylamine---corrinoid protein Co-methyltransferase
MLAIWNPAFAVLLPQLAICNEILSWLEAFMKGIEISDETLCLDLIDKIGPEGQYLDCQHTLDNFRNRWYPNLFDRSSYDGWKAKGGKSLGERAVEEVDRILEEHKPEPLPKDIAKAIRKVTQDAESNI